MSVYQLRSYSQVLEYKVRQVVETASHSFAL
jgi:hypothetical protein